MTPLFTKLRYGAAKRICVLGAPSGFEAELKKEKLAHASALKTKERFDIVHVFATRQSELTQSASKLKRAIAEDGILWVSYPKGDALKTDLKRDVLRELLADSGLEAVAQVAIDEVWSAMRFKVLENG